MTLTKDELYDLYDGSWENKFTNKLDKDIFGIRDKTPEEALEVLTEAEIETTIEGISEKITRLDNGDLGIRKDVLSLGLTDRYLGLKNTLEEIGNDTTVASQEFVKKALGFAPKEILLLILNAENDESIHRYFTGLTDEMLATEDTKSSEALYFITNLLHKENSLGAFYGTLLTVIDKLEMFHGYVYEQRYYNPDNLNRAIRETITSDVKWGNVREFPIDEYITGTARNGIFTAYLDIIKPMKETKALTKLWEDDVVKDILTKSDVAQYTFDMGKYIFENNVLVLLRDGLTIVEPSGEFTHIPSSKVTKTVKEDLVKRLGFAG